MTARRRLVAGLDSYVFPVLLFAALAGCGGEGARVADAERRLDALRSLTLGGAAVLFFVSSFVRLSSRKGC